MKHASIVELSIDEIKLTGWNPRKNFDEEKLRELADSIREHGILEPLIVRQHNGTYELVAGERRLRAAKLAGLEKVPVVVRELDDNQVRELMLLENLQREDLNPLEEAQALQSLLAQGITQEELGKKLGKSQAWIANRLRLLKAPVELQEMLISREISPKHVLMLLPYIEYPVFTEKILPEMKRHLRVQGTLSVKSLESIIKDAIKYDWNAKCVLDLSSPPYSIAMYKAYMDLDGCDACKHAIRFENDQLRSGPYCPNRDCWQEKVEKAKQEYEKEKEKLLKDGDTVDTSELNWNEFCYFHRNLFDMSECEGCEHRKKNTDGDPLCLNPECFRKKTDAWRREQDRLKREAEKKALEVLDDYIEKFCYGEENEKFESVLVPVRALRAIFGYFEESVWIEDFKKAVKPWKDRGHIPDQELDKAILRLLVIHELVDLNVKSVERMLRGWEKEYSSPISIAEAEEG